MIQSLMRQCWDPLQEIRPTFKQVMKVLQSEVLIDNSSGQTLSLELKTVQ